MFSGCFYNASAGRANGITKPEQRSANACFWLPFDGHEAEDIPGGIRHLVQGEVTRLAVQQVGPEPCFLVVTIEHGVPDRRRLEREVGAGQDDFFVYVGHGLSIGGSS